MRPPFPDVVDSTILSTAKSCLHKAYRQYIEHWKPGEDSVHLIAGGAFAAGLETARRAFYVEKQSAEEALAQGLASLWAHYGDFEPPEDSPKGPLRMAGALEFYFSQYPLGADGATPHVFGARHGIEFSFAEPLSVRHPVTGDPIIYAGRADMVADAFGGLFLYDEKTASQLGPSWLRQWEHRSQFTGYCWGLRGHGFQPTGVVVRGVSILKGGYGTAQAVTYRSAWEVDRWLFETEVTVRRMIQAWEAGYWNFNLDHACAEYGGCAFQRVCKSPEPEKWLPLYFHKRRWDPLARVEIKEIANV
jgi:hypothetical protein